jgi:glycolate oxidase
VTVLFADAVSSTSIAERIGAEEMYAVMQDCVARMIEAVNYYAGHVVQFTGDGVMATFGAPIGGEESERRAVAAALRMQRSLQDQAAAAGRRQGVELVFRIGLNTGPVVVGDVSNELTGGVTAIGDAVNLAARMQQLADPGSVYVTETTYQETASYFDYEALGALLVKGKAEPVRTYRVLGERPHRTRFQVAAETRLTPLVGRTADLALLEEIWLRAREGTGQVVFVSGEAGIGKSRLLAELRRRLGDEVTWLQAYCSSWSAKLPLAPLAALVRGALGVEEGSDDEAVLRAVEQAVSGWGKGSQAAAPFLLYLFGVEPVDEVAAMDPRLRRARVFEAVRTLVTEESARRPLVLVVEDLHWVDPVSERGLAILADGLRSLPVLLLLTMRPDRVHSLGERAHFHRLVVDPLPDDESVAFVRSVLGPADVPPELVDGVVEKSDGNPFYLEEVVRSLLESGVLALQGDRYGLARPMEQVAVPNTVQEVVLSRLDRLEPAVKATVQLASVIGRQFSRHLLEEVSENGADLESSLALLEGRGLILQKPHRGESIYEFRHALTQEVAYETLLLRRRRALHRRVAEAIEHRYVADHLADQYETLAHHYDEAGTWEKALDYLVLAGRKAATRFAGEDAQRYFARAREVCEKLDDPTLAASASAALKRATDAVVLEASPEEREFLDDVRAIVGPQRCQESPYARALYRRDASFLNAEPLAVVAPGSVEELAAVIRTCRRYEVPFTPRGAGTGLAGGAIPLGPERRPLVVSLSRLDAILSIDPDERVAWVQPGVINTRLSEVVAQFGLRYAPDPSSQIACTLGGNVATNAGGAHCLAYGPTANHVVALELMDADGELHTFGSTAPEWNGYDLRGVTVGSEGTFGFVTKACLRLLPYPPTTKTVLFAFPSLREAASAVSAIIERGGAPAALEVMDAGAVQLVEEYSHAGYPRHAGAVLLAEFEGLPHEVEADARLAGEAAQANGSDWVRVAEADDERANLWRGRKAIAGAIARLVPEYYLHDVVVPRSRLADVVDEINTIVAEEKVRVLNVHHAGDGNLHPLLLFDRSESDAQQRVFSAGRRIVGAAIAAGGVLTGEHGIGAEKRDFLCEVLAADDLDAQLRVRRAMEPTGLANPGKVLPSPSSCGDRPVRLIPQGAWL